MKKTHEIIALTATSLITSNNDDIAYWSSKHNAWILHKKFRYDIIHENEFPRPHRSKEDAVKMNMEMNPKFYNKER